MTENIDNNSDQILIQIEDYSKKLKNLHLENINFNVTRGKIHALIGASGSGKTILLKSIIGALPNQSYQGKITINGFKAGSAKAKNSIGYALNLENFPQNLSAYKFLKYVSQATTISENQLNENIEILLKKFNLWEQRNEKLSSFPSLIKKQIMLIVTLIHNPDLIILDEIENNLDSEAKKIFISILKDLKVQGKTILLTTTVLDEFQDIIDECTIIESGKVLYNGTISKFDVGKIYILNTDKNELAVQILKQTNFNFSYQAENNVILIRLANQEQVVQLNQLLFYNQVNIINLSKNELNLDFLKSQI